MQRQLVAAVDWVSTSSCDKLSNITQPMLIILGTEDAFTPAANSYIMAEKIPGARLVLIRGAGHGLMHQYPDIFNSMVTTFSQASVMKW
ncbi:MAG: alpha/beta fold hydrolase [Nitrososphaeraceae archaeon]